MTRRSYLRLIFIALLVVTLAASTLLYIKPLDEWSGLSKVSFEEQPSTSSNLPSDSHLIFTYTTGFTGGAMWRAFSASPQSLTEFVNKEFGVPYIQLNNWIAGQDAKMPMVPPPRARWRNHGYWDLDYKTSGKYAVIQKGDTYVALFIDTVKSRIYYIKRN